MGYIYQSGGDEWCSPAQKSLRQIVSQSHGSAPHFRRERGHHPHWQSSSEHRQYNSQKQLRPKHSYDRYSFGHWARRTVTKVSADNNTRCVVLGLLGPFLNVIIIVDVAVHSTDVQNREHGHGAYREDDSCRQHHPPILANVVRELTENRKRQGMNGEADQSDDTTIGDDRDLDVCE